MLTLFVLRSSDNNSLKTSKEAVCLSGPSIHIPFVGALIYASRDLENILIVLENIIVFLNILLTAWITIQTNHMCCIVCIGQKEKNKFRYVYNTLIIMLATSVFSVQRL